MNNALRTSAPRGFSAVPFLGDLLVLTRLLRDSEAKLGLKVIALLTLLYVVSPIDFIPEAVMPMIAWIDDVGVVLAVRAWLDPELAKYRYPLFGKPDTSGWQSPAGQASAFAAPPSNGPVAQAYGPASIHRRPAPF